MAEVRVWWPWSEAHVPTDRGTSAVAALPWLRSLPVGDHRHGNDAGYKALADSIDLRLFD